MSYLLNLTIFRRWPFRFYLYFFLTIILSVCMYTNSVSCRLHNKKIKCNLLYIYNYHNIVWQHIHKQGGDVPTMDIIPESPLKIITGIQKNRIRSFLHKLINCSVDSSDTSYTVLLLTLSAGPRRRARLFESVLT